MPKQVRKKRLDLWLQNISYWCTGYGIYFGTKFRPELTITFDSIVGFWKFKCLSRLEKSALTNDGNIFVDWSTGYRMCFWRKFRLELTITFDSMVEF